MGRDQRWQTGHQWLLRPDSFSRRIVSPQRLQGWPPLRYTQAMPP